MSVIASKVRRGRSPDAGLTWRPPARRPRTRLHELSAATPGGLSSSRRQAAIPPAEKLPADAKLDHPSEHRARLFHHEQTPSSKTRKNLGARAEHVFDKLCCRCGGARVVHEHRRRDIRELVENVAVDRPIRANRRPRAHLQVFNGPEREIIAPPPTSPCAGIKPTGKENARDRMLSGRRDQGRSGTPRRASVAPAGPA